MQTRETFGEILSGNHRFLRPDIRLVTPYHCIYLTSFTFFCGEASHDGPMTGIQNVRKRRQFVLVYCGQKNVNKIMPDFEQN